MVFTEKRESPIKWTDSIKTSWLQSSATKFTATAQPGEFFVFQIGVSGLSQPLENVQLLFHHLQNESRGIVSSKQITCFNQSGINFNGSAFIKKIDVASNQVQALWIGVDIPSSAKGISNLI